MRLALTFCAALALAFTPSRVSAQAVEQLYLDDALAGTSGAFVDLHVRALTITGEPVSLTRPWPFKVLQDGRTIPPDDIEVLRLEETGAGTSWVLVLDVGRSMKGPFDQAREAAIEFVGRLRENDALAIVTASASPELVSTFDASKEARVATLRSLSVESQFEPTRLFDAVFLGLEQLRIHPEIPRRGAVVAISDGRDGESRKQLDMLLEVSRGAGPQQSRLPVFGVAYMDPRFGAVASDLQTLVEGTNGTFLRNPRSSFTLGGFYTNVWSQMLLSQVIRFPAELDGAPHDIELTLGPGVQTRSLIYPDRGPTLPSWLLWLIPPLLAIAAGLAALLLWRGQRTGVLVWSHEAGGQLFPLRHGLNAIGALPENDIVLPSATVSRRHAVIRVEAHGVEIEDRQSANGTHVNDKPVGVAPLRPGDRIRLGDVELVYRR